MLVRCLSNTSPLLFEHPNKIDEFAVAVSRDAQKLDVLLRRMLSVGERGVTKSIRQCEIYQ